MVGPELRLLPPEGGPTPESNEVDKNAMGGTELQKHELYRRLDDSLLDDFQIICSRVRALDKDRMRVLWLHDLPNDPESAHLADGGWKNFDKLVYVSHWQRQQYEMFLGVPPSAGVVLQNSINPIEAHTKPDVDDVIRLVYYSTPHRGLSILNEVFKHLSPQWQANGLNVELEVFSSFELYGWGQRDEPFQPLFDELRGQDKVVYHGAVPNEEIHEAIQRSHIWCLPSIWPETACICLMEAMSGGLTCVHSSLAGLPETAANWTMMYDITEDMQDHVNRFAQWLVNAVNMVAAKDERYDQRLHMQKSYADGFYSWDTREIQWQQFLTHLKENPDFSNRN